MGGIVFLFEIVDILAIAHHRAILLFTIFTLLFIIILPFKRIFPSLLTTGCRALLGPGFLALYRKTQKKYPVKDFFYSR